MQKLEPPDSHYLSAAQGWLGLGDWISANQELDKIATEYCADLSVLQVRLQVYAAAKQWAMAVGIARAIALMNPDQPSGWVDWAYALYELGRPNEARSVLLSVVEKFPKDHLIRYCLACYACQLGNLKEALEWLEKAKSLTEPQEVKELVLKNPYLKPLWNEITGC